MRKTRLGSLHGSIICILGALNCGTTFAQTDPSNGKFVCTVLWITGNITRSPDTDLCANFKHTSGLYKYWTGDHHEAALAMRPALCRKMMATKYSGPPFPNCSIADTTVTKPQ